MSENAGYMSGIIDPEYLCIYIGILIYNMTGAYLASFERVTKPQSEEKNHSYLQEGHLKKISGLQVFQSLG